MKLNVLERILLPQMVKTAIKQGSLIEMMSVEHIIKKIGFTENEISDYNLKTANDGTITWSPEKVIELDVEFTKEQQALLNKVVDYFDSNKLIELNMITLIMKIKEFSCDEESSN